MIAAQRSGCAQADVATRCSPVLRMTTAGRLSGARHRGDLVAGVGIDAEGDGLWAANERSLLPDLTAAHAGRLVRASVRAGADQFAGCGCHRAPLRRIVEQAGSPRVRCTSLRRQVGPGPTR